MSIKCRSQATVLMVLSFSILASCARESRHIRWIADLPDPERLRASQLLNTPSALRHDDAHKLLMQNARIRAG